MQTVNAQVEADYMKYVNFQKAIGNTDYYNFDSWVKDNHPEYMFQKQKSSVDDMTTRHYVAKQLGFGSNIWAAALQDMDSALSQTNFPGLNMIVDDGKGVGTAKSTSKRLRKRHYLKKHQSHVAQLSTLSRRRHSFHRRADGRYQVKWRMEAIANSLASWRQATTPEFVWEKMVATSSESHDIKTQGVDGPGIPSLPYIGDILSLSSGGGHSSQQDDTEDDKVDVKVTFQGLGIYKVTPGTWWQPNWGYPALVDPHIHKEFQTADPKAIYNFDSYFAPGRKLNRIHSHALIAYKPSITLTSSRNKTSKLHDQWNAGAKACVLFICSGANGGNDHTSSEIDSTGTQLTISLNVDAPIIIGKGYDVYS